jgi:glutamyl-tRNA reductase
MLISLGLDFGFAPIGVRERFHRSEAEMRELYASGDRTVITEVVFVTTCNRLELYGWTPRGGRDAEGAFRALAARWAPDREDADALLLRARRRCGRSAARHLIGVAAGLESQILGDIHILGQLRKSFRVAQEADVLGPHVHRLFEAAFRAGKAVRRETELMAGRSSVGSEAAGMVLRSSPAPERAHVVVLGCGKVGTHAAETLAGGRVGRLTLVNRTRSTAEQLAKELNADVVDWADRNELLADADAAIVATGAPEPVLTVPEVDALRRPAGSEGDRPLLLIDVGMPRNVAAATGEAPSVSLVDLDSLHPQVAAVERARQAAVPQAEALVEEEVETFFDWLALEPAKEALEPLREALTEVCRKELIYAAGEEVAARTTGRIVAKVLAGPMLHLRWQCKNGRPVDDVADVITNLFPEDLSRPRAVHGD